MTLLMAYREEPSPLHSLLAFMRDVRFNAGLRCPRCGSDRVHRWGGFSGRQRYRCRGSCGRTFSDLTMTPAAYIKKLRLWPAHARCLAETATLRAAAAHLGVHVGTAFRWRHRILDGFRALDSDGLSGQVEVRFEWVVESRKGERRLDRPPRRHGIRYPTLTGVPRRRLLIACDRRHHVVAALLEGERVGPEELANILAHRLVGRPTLISEGGRFAVTRRVADRLDLPYQEARPGSADRRGVDRTAHVRNAWAYGWRLRRWMSRFRGVATRYLPNYLIWHRRVDAHERQGVAGESLRWPIPA